MQHYGAEIFWLQTAPREPSAALQGDGRADVVIIGGGFTGLWTAYHLKRADPGIDVAIVEAGEIGSGASGRNGGFAMTLLDMSLALLAKNHGDEAARVAHNAVATSVDEIGAAADEHGIDCDYHKGGLLVVATNDAQQARLDRDLDTVQRLGLHGYRSLTEAETRARLDSPTYRGGYHEQACAIVHPARLARGLDQVVRAQGARVFEHTSVQSVARDGDQIAVRCEGGTLRAQQVVFATNAWSSKLSPFEGKVAPLYTYVVLTEPLTTQQRALIGWSNREGVEDKRNYVHYYRTTFDGRILWGGGDGVTYRDLGIRPAYDSNPDVFASLEASFRQTFPQLRDVGFSHRWGGPVAITVPFVPYMGTTGRDRFHYAFGYNGHGVAPTHTAAKLLAARVLGQKSELEALPFVDGKEARMPTPLLAYAGSALVRRALRRQDAQMDAGKSGGDMDPWLMRAFRKLS